MSLVKRLPFNETGQDFVVGDIHGHFGTLEQMLEALNFNRETDRLISVGDLIDRGPDSLRALEFLAEPWFHAVVGNHEDLMLKTLQGDSSSEQLWHQVGGRWAIDQDLSTLKELATVFEQKLHYMIEVPTVHGLVGITHADFPDNISWTTLFSALENGDANNQHLRTLCWSRERFRRLQLTSIYPGKAPPEKPIDGIHRLYVGHNVVNQVTGFGNVVFMETGIYCGGQLSMTEIHSEEIFSLAAESVV